MRTINILGILVLIMSLSACKSSKKAEEPVVVKETTKEEITPVSSGKPLVSMEIWNREQAKAGPDSFRLVVTFISIGAGTDPESRGILEAYVYDYKLKKGTPVSYFMIPWGREGEVDCCFPLNELTSSEQLNFIEGLKKAITGHELIQVNENMKSRFK